MAGKFQNKYRISSARLQNWDYGWNAPYFITICTRNRECFFGEILNGVMNLSETGKMVEYEWKKSIDIRPDMNLELDAFVVMPNHFHGIIIIGENKYNRRDGGGGRDAMHCVSTSPPQPTPPPPSPPSPTPPPLSTEPPTEPATDSKPKTNINKKPKNQFGPQSKNLASILRGFKSAVTKNARQIHAGFAWQPRFNDHIIRNDHSFKRIQNYINTNIENWENDKFND